MKKRIKNCHFHLITAPDAKYLILTLYYDRGFKIIKI